MFSIPGIRHTTRYGVTCCCVPVCSVHCVVKECTVYVQCTRSHGTTVWMRCYAALCGVIRVYDDGLPVCKLHMRRIICDGAVMWLNCILRRQVNVDATTTTSQASGSKRKWPKRTTRLARSVCI